MEARTRVIQWDIRKNLNCLRTEPQPFDLIFMDPPYETDAVLPTLTALTISGMLADTARIVVEHSRRETILPVPAGLVLVSQRQFGKTLVSFLNAVL